MAAWRFFVVVTAIVLELSPCSCQFGGGMGEMMGGMGGIAAMMGGGMGGLGGMMGGGMGGIGSMISQSARQSGLRSINEAVRFVVGPQASPDQMLINYGMQQMAPPRTLTEMLGYVPHFQRIARAIYRPWLTSMVSENTSTSSSATPKPGATGTTGGKTLAQLEADLDGLVMQRAIEYLNRPENQQSSNAASMMSSIGMMIPMMTQGFASAFA